jgi:hypothetical protein
LFVFRDTPDASGWIAATLHKGFGPPLRRFLSAQATGCNGLGCAKQKA